MILSKRSDAASCAAASRPMPRLAPVSRIVGMNERTSPACSPGGPVREAHERVSCIEELSHGHDAGRRQDHMPHKPGSKAAAETVHKHNKVASCSITPHHSR